MIPNKFLWSLIKPVFYVLVKLHSKWRYINYKRKINQLIAKGLIVGENVTIMPSVSIDDVYPYLISIGNNCSISNGTIILAHDATAFKFSNGYARLGRVDIYDNVFIGQSTIILPNVKIGPNVLIAAGSLINKSIPPNSCVAGVPARVYSKFDELIEKHEQAIKESDIYSYEEIQHANKYNLPDKIRKQLENGTVYVKGYTGKFPWTIKPTALN